MEKVKELLREQLGLLAEASKRKGIAPDDLCNLSGTMAAISESLCECHRLTMPRLDLSLEPDKYELRPLGEKPEQGR